MRMRMKSLVRFDATYFGLAITLFIVEVLIAAFLHDRIIRPYFGDFLVVILIYCFLRSFLRTPVLATAIASLLFAYFVEVLQYLNIVNKLGLQNSSMARTVIGVSFEWIDMAAYTAGIIFVLVVERMFSKTRYE